MKNKSLLGILYYPKDANEFSSLTIPANQDWSCVIEQAKSLSVNDFDCNLKPGDKYVAEIIDKIDSQNRITRLFVDGIVKE